MNIEKLTALINSTQPEKGKKGKPFFVDFTKRDGSLRTIKGRLGLQRNLTGKGMSFNPATKGLMPVWSIGDQGYRMVNLNTVSSLQIGKKVYDSNGDEVVVA